MQTVFSFFRLTLLGMGLQKTKIKMNTKWLSLAAIVPALIMMKHVSFSPNLYNTALTVLRNVSRDLEPNSKEMILTDYFTRIYRKWFFNLLLCCLIVD
jgi:hypothetical protein